ncbi:MAG: sugar porter family MFS transporter [Candidatus Nealsonbacteria bacterium]|nr:sugar porter family MFS transporter [Candidatus Nealsonbacteria bacterium]
MQSSGSSRSYVLRCAVVAALAGFLFGFDTIVISGAEQRIQTIWRLDGGMHGWCMSAALWGTVLGALFGGWPTERFGRRKTLLWIGALYFVSAVGSAVAPEEYFFMVARFIGGLGVGIATVASPMYISEISPPKLRGRLAGMFQFNIVFGILIAFVSNYFIGKWVHEEIAWRWMLGVEAFPALLYAVLCFGIPESPRWLITHGGQREAGTEIFRKINPGFSESEIQQLVDSVDASVGDRATAAKFFTMRLRVPIMLAFLIAAFNQLSGINAILYFAPRLLGLAGIPDPLSASIGIGVTNLIFTFVGLWLIDKLGRRTLLYIGSFGYIASLAVCAFAFLTDPAFRVVSSAIDVEDAVKQVVGVEDPDTPLPDKEKDEIRDDYGTAKQSLVAATSREEYPGEALVIPEDTDPAGTKALAVKAKDEASKILGSKKFVVLFSIMAFIAAHAIGQGAVIWVFISEIFPNRNRAAGQSLGSSTHWLFAAVITLLFPIAIKAFDAGVLFAFFCAMMCLQLVWVKLMVPETKGVPLEEMQKELGIE